VISDDFNLKHKSKLFCSFEVDLPMIFDYFNRTFKGNYLIFLIDLLMTINDLNLKHRRKLCRWFEMGLPMIFDDFNLKYIDNGCCFSEYDSHTTV
jgi:hypothetical protein